MTRMAMIIARQRLHLLESIETDAAEVLSQSVLAGTLCFAHSGALADKYAYRCAFRERRWVGFGTVDEEHDLLQHSRQLVSCVVVRTAGEVSRSPVVRAITLTL